MGLAGTALRLQGDPTPNGADERFEILSCVVESEGTTNRAFEPETGQNRPRTAMAGAHRDPFAIKRFADVLGLAAVDDEGHDACALARRADEAHAADGS